MSANDDESSIEEVGSIRRRRVITHGSQCRSCGEVARPRAEDGKYRRFTCRNEACPHFIAHRNRRYWTVPIPAQSILREITGQRSASLDETIHD
jgi:hypothetical protein